MAKGFWRMNRSSLGLGNVLNTMCISLWPFLLPSVLYSLKVLLHAPWSPGSLGWEAAVTQLHSSAPAHEFRSIQDQRTYNSWEQSQQVLVDKHSSSICHPVKGWPYLGPLHLGDGKSQEPASHMRLWFTWTGNGLSDVLKVSRQGGLESRGVSKGPRKGGKGCPVQEKFLKVQD